MIRNMTSLCMQVNLINKEILLNEFIFNSGMEQCIIVTLIYSVFKQNYHQMTPLSFIFDLNDAWKMLTFNHEQIVSLFQEK